MEFLHEGTGRHGFALYRTRCGALEGSTESALPGYRPALGLGIITILLFLMAGINVLTKTTATIAGTIFTIVFFIAFSLSERYWAVGPDGMKKAKRSYSGWRCATIYHRSL
jgi:hypothetical protein